MTMFSKGLLGLGCACLVALGIYAKGYQDAGTKYAQEAAQAQLEFNKQREQARVQSQNSLARIAHEWQAYLQAQSSMADGTINQLRADGIRLSVELADVRVCAVTGRCGPVVDGRAELSANTSRFLIEQAQRADAQVSALQNIIRELQGERQGGS